jgi:hypothetical protein
MTYEILIKMSKEISLQRQVENQKKPGGCF